MSVEAFCEAVGKRYGEGAGIEDAAEAIRRLRGVRPGTRGELRDYVQVHLGVNVPDERVCEGHDTPMDYLWHCYSADMEGTRKANGDATVWANRGGGKTQLAAAATLLDCVFKPKCQVRILAGSGEQAGRMYDYLAGFAEEGFGDLVDGRVLNDRCKFLNGSNVEVLTQSAKSVRGQHVQKLRCDEVELFDERVFSAAKFVTQSKGGVAAAMEIISTMHRPYGLMQKAVTWARENGTPLFKWCVWEVIERCVGRNCSQCPLSGDCGGKAKRATGYLSIDDCITQMRRASRQAWEAEMLCMRPNRENAVFSDFSPEEHVAEAEYDANLPLYRAMDFGFVNPFVCLWVQVDGDKKVRVIDEYVRNRATIDVHAAEVKRRTPGGEARVAATFCDPAGNGREQKSGTSVIEELRRMGVVTRSRGSNILEGVELIRRAVRNGAGKSSLVISPRCGRLIEAMRCYHYPDSNRVEGGSEQPEKDGVYDHAIDALRYFFVNYSKGGPVKTRSY